MNTEQAGPENSDQQKSASETQKEAASFQSDQIKTHTMEVHHHPDLHHKKKQWKEYFLEFMMIFLAVTLGFLAENLREHISESDKERVFAGSLYADFNADTSTLHQLIDYTVAKIKNIDSLEDCIHKAGNRYNDSTLYGCVLYLISTFQFDNVNGTYEQLKSSGSLRFFKQSLVNNLNSYDATSLKLKLMEDWENKFLYEKVNPQTQQMCSCKVFNDLRAGTVVKHEMYLKNMNEESIDVLLNQAELIKRLRERQLNQHRILLQKANEILIDLKEEYHL
jgi:hypothetical protein